MKVNSKELPAVTKLSSCVCVCVYILQSSIKINTIFIFLTNVKSYKYI